MSRLLLLAALLAAGCVPSATPPRAPNVTPPASFGAPAPDAASIAQQTWGEFFASAELRDLIDTAMANNRELNAQLQEIIIARNEVSARQGDYLPKVGVEAGAGVEKVGRDTSQGRSDEAHGVPEHLGSFGFGLTGSWEIDVWKKLRNAAKAAGLRYLASIEGRNFLKTQIVAEIARSYFELVALDRRIEILKRNVEIQTNALEVVRLEKLAARVTELAVQRFEAELLKNRSRLYDVQQEQVQTENRINFLVGRFPQPVRRSARDFEAPLPRDVHAGLPSKLLENRPDVRQAELAMEAAKLDVAAARAAFYPALSIDAEVGYRSFNARHLVTTPESLAYNLAGNLGAPLLNRAALTADYRSANAKQQEAVFQYEKTLLQAFTDVANQLATIDNLQKSYDLQSRQVATLAQAVETSSILFQSARADYVEILLTRRDSLDAQMELVETRRRQYEALVNVYQALGGGWRSAS